MARIFCSYSLTADAKHFIYLFTYLFLCLTKKSAFFGQETCRTDGSRTVVGGSNSISTELASAINDGLYFYEQVGEFSFYFSICCI